MKQVWIINIALVRGPATIQAGMQYDDKARALRVFDQLRELWATGRDLENNTSAEQPHRFIHDMGQTVIVPGEIATMALLPHEIEEPRNSFGGPVPAYVPDPIPPGPIANEPPAASVSDMLDAAVAAARPSGG